ncbi:slx1 [Symbiodinium natans]|uniref:Slx1 protein n=1 Tax=Symbiodinium natans TaxID=878477 RepID=A0A812NUC1_9DINO|nr:slx1 [Symbiodinium natans]
MEPGGLFFKYSDIKLEENMEASFSLNSPGANCSSNSAFGPNECCLQFGVGIDATVHAVLPKELTKDAVMTTKVSAWYKGWIPLWDSMTCKICGEPCNACPSISQYLPSVFPCQPQPTPDCPIPAGSVNEKASVTLPVDVQKTVAGSKATVTYSLTRADGSIVTSGEIFAKDLIKKEASAQDSRRPEAQRVREAETKQKRVDEHMRSACNLHAHSILMLRNVDLEEDGPTTVSRLLSSFAFLSMPGAVLLLVLYVVVMTVTLG